MEPTARPAINCLALFVAYTAILYFSFANDGYGILARPCESPAFGALSHPRDAYIGYDSYLVLNRIRLAHEGKIGRLAPMGEYYSQAGLQAALLSGIQQTLRLEPVTFSYIAARAFCLMTAGVLALFFVSVTGQLGAVAGASGVVLTAFSPILLKFCPSLYWASFVLFAPFVAAWCLWPRLAKTKRGTPVLCSVIAFLVMIKCLCGYEYITCVILSPIVAVAFHRSLAGTLGWRFVGQAAALWSAGVVGFAAAFGLHVLQLNRLPEVRERFPGGGIQVILNRASQRTVGEQPYPPGYELISDTPMAGLSPATSKKIRAFWYYFTLPAASTPQAFPLLRREVKVWHVCVFAAGVMALAVLNRNRSPELRALAVALGLGFASSLSWQVMAINHMAIHQHLNQVVFLLPFLPLAYVTAGYVLQGALARVRLETFTARFVLPSAAVFLLTAAVLERECESIRASTEKAAWTAVRAYLDSEAKPASANIRGSVGDHVHIVNFCADEMARSSLMGAGSKAADIVLIRGWAFDQAGPAVRKRLLDLPKQGVSVVVTQGNHFVPSRVSYFRLPHLRRALGLDGAGTGFELHVPDVYTDAAQPLRVFLVSESDRSQVCELALPERIEIR